MRGNDSGLATFKFSSVFISCLNFCPVPGPGSCLRAPPAHDPTECGRTTLLPDTTRWGEEIDTNPSFEAVRICPIPRPLSKFEQGHSQVKISLAL